MTYPATPVLTQHSVRPHDHFALEIEWAEGDLPALVGPFVTREEASDWAALNVPNGSWECRPLAHPYLRRTR